MREHLRKLFVKRNPIFNIFKEMKTWYCIPKIRSGCYKKEMKKKRKRKGY
jgi:hypothetical protein